MQIGSCILIYELGAIFHGSQYLESPILNVFYNIGPRMCKSRCIRTVGCNSFNFVKDLMYCELLNSTQSVIPVDREHYMYSNMSTWTIDQDACWPNPCLEDTCVIVYGGLPICIPFEKSEYIGCFSDDGDRHFKYAHKYFGNSMSLAACRTHCGAHGYRFAGLQYYAYCYCGNDWINSKYPKVSESECNTYCYGEPKRNCGGYRKNSIYIV
ncbi:uncharacterized protein [Mytilus edulis]|uniref:uncharacterized protein n=1 Tax=Mytilus edulis TaxID=6550 RepID=UPI0039EEC056